MTSRHGVSRQPFPSAFCFEGKGQRYNSTLFVHEVLIRPHERLAFQIVKEQPMFSGQKPDASSQTGRLRVDSAAQGCGGAGRDRTDDPLLAKQVLSQLSYSPFQQSAFSTQLSATPRHWPTVFAEC